MGQSRWRICNTMQHCNHKSKIKALHVFAIVAFFIRERKIWWTPRHSLRSDGAHACTFSVHIHFLSLSLSVFPYICLSMYICIYHISPYQEWKSLRLIMITDPPNPRAFHCAWTSSHKQVNTRYKIIFNTRVTCWRRSENRVQFKMVWGCVAINTVIVAYTSRPLTPLQWHSSVLSGALCSTTNRDLILILN